jgi:lipopolysaccharide exporter
MASKNYWIKSGTYSMMQRVTAFLFGFGSYFFLVRYYSIDYFGVWTLYVVISSAVEMSRSSFIQNAFLKFYQDPSVDRSKLFYSSFVLNALSTLVIILILLGTIPVMTQFWDTQMIGSLVVCYCLTSIVLIPFTQLNYLEQANHSFKGTFWSSAVRQGLFFLIVIICFIFFRDMPLVFFAAAQTVSAVVGLLTALFMNRKLIPRPFVFEWITVGSLYKFGRYILGTGITSTIGKNADQMILGSVSHPMVAIYNACIRILNFIEIPTLSISNVVYPKIAARASEGRDAVGDMYEKSVATMISIILPAILFTVAVPSFVLTLIAGAKYQVAADALQVVAIASFFLPFNIQVGCACEVINKPHVSFYINLVANVMNIFLNILLIKYLGVMGCAIAFALTVISIFSVGQYYISTRMNVKLFRIFARVLENYRNGLRWVYTSVYSKYL